MNEKLNFVLVLAQLYASLDKVTAQYSAIVAGSPLIQSELSNLKTSAQNVSAELLS